MVDSVKPGMSSYLCTMSKDLQVSKAATSRALDNLVAEGHAERITKADDKRRRYVTITEAGRLFIAKLCVAT